MRILIDTNLWISALISPSTRDRLYHIIANKEIDIIGSSDLIQELMEVILRPKFRKYLTVEQAKEFIDILTERLDLITSTTVVNVCRDPNDDYLLGICLDGRIDYFVTGDNDLLVLNPFHQTTILTLTDFEQI